MLPFEEEILEDINWRNEQLLFAKTIPHIYSFSDSHRQFIVKHSIPIIYSVWEGFVQNCFQIYIRELNRSGLNRDAFCEHILSHTIDSAFPQLKEYPKDFTGRMKFLTKLNTFFQNEFSVSSVINTESNVELETLNRIMFRFNLKLIPSYPYRLKLKNLLMFRNRIAHGDIFVIVDESTLADFQSRVNEYVILVGELMEMVFQNISIGYKVEKSHMKVSSVLN